MSYLHSVTKPGWGTDWKFNAQAARKSRAAAGKIRPEHPEPFDPGSLRIANLPEPGGSCAAASGE